MAKPPGRTYEDRLIRVLNYIHDNPTGDLSLDTLADVAAMSRFHWHRVYHAMTGETCAQTVRRMRLHRAAGRLVRETTPVDRIARDLGYDNAKSFAHAFRATYGQTPVAFRKSGRLDAPALLLRNGENTMQHPTEIRTMPARRVIGAAHQGSYMTIGKTFEEMGAKLATRGLMADCGPVIGLYYDDPDATPEADLRSFAGAAWPGDELPDGFDMAEIAGGRTVVLTFKGPYAQIKRGYDELFGTWLPQSGEEPGEGACYEVYLNDPRSTPPEELLTEICLPLAG